MERLTSTLNDAEHTLVARARASTALCIRHAAWPPPAPNVECSCDMCGTVWRTFLDDQGRWEWLIAAERGACFHTGTVTRYSDGTVDCDGCGERLALFGAWDAI